VGLAATVNAVEVLEAHVRVNGDVTFGIPPTSGWTLLSQNVETNMNYRTGVFRKDMVGVEHGMTVQFPFSGASASVTASFRKAGAALMDTVGGAFTVAGVTTDGAD